MTLTKKDPAITISFAEQIELRRFMAHPLDKIGVDLQRNPIRRTLVESLASKGYITKVDSANGFDYYTLTAE